MKESDVRARAFAMPLTSPAFPPGPYRFRQREYLIIAYRTDPDTLRALVPERWRSMSLLSNTSLSACRTRPASAITPKPAR